MQLILVCGPWSSGTTVVAGLLGVAAARTDVRPERSCGVLGEPVLRDPGPGEALAQIERAVGGDAGGPDRRRERDG